MRPDDVLRHEAQLAALARDLDVLGLSVDVEVHCGRRGQWLVTPGDGVRSVPPARLRRQGGVRLVRVGTRVLHLTTDDLQTFVLVAADLAVHGRATQNLDDGGEYCLTTARPILMRHPSQAAPWWCAPSGPVAELGRLGDAKVFESNANRSSGMIVPGRGRFAPVIGGSLCDRHDEVNVNHG